MKIGDLFISLGFQIEGKAEFDAVGRGLEDAAKTGAKATVAINAINAALLAMLDISARAGMALRNFAITTGLSTDELQRWQHTAAINGLTAEEMTGAIKKLQDAQTAFAFGEPQSVGAWSLLGVNPLQDPFALINNLRTALAGVQPMIARGLLSRVGLENLAPLIQAPKSDFESWSKNFIVSKDQIDRLAKLNAAWESLKRSMVGVRNEASAALAPAFTRVVRGLEWLADKLAIVTDWLSKAEGIAPAVRYAIIALAFAFLALGAALGVATIAATALAVALWVSGLGPAILLVTAAIAILVGGIAAIVLLLDDLWTAAHGGKSAFDWLPITLDGVRLLEGAFSTLWDVLKGIGSALAYIGEMIKSVLGSGSGGFEKLFRALPNWAIGVTSTPSPVDNLGEKMARAETMRVLNQIRQENNVQVHVNGAGSPEATGRAVGRSVRQELDSAAFQAPVPNL